MRIGRAASNAVRHACATLQRMRQLVGDQLSSRLSLGLELAGSEHDVLAERVRPCVDGPCGLGGALVGVDADLSEVVAEARLEKRPRRRIERRARAEPA